MENKDSKNFVSKAMGAAKSAPAPAKSEAKPEMKKAVMDKATAGLGGNKSGKGPRSTHIEHHTNGSHTVKHQMRTDNKTGMVGDSDSEQSYAVANTADLMAKLKEILGAGSSEPEAKPAPAAPVSSAAPAPAAAAPSMP